MIVPDTTAAGTLADAAFCARTAASASGREGQSVACQTPGQHRPRPRQPRRQRPLGTTEAPGRLLVSLAFQVAKDHRHPVLVGQAAQLLVEKGHEIAPKVLLDSRFRHRRDLPFPRPPSDGRGPGLERRLVSNAIEPVGDQRPRLNRRRFAEQHKERGLECILRIMVAADDTPANAPDHRPMAAHQSSKCRLLALLEVALQQLPIAESPAVSQQGPAAEVLHDLAQLTARHVDASQDALAWPLPIISHEVGFPCIYFSGSPLLIGCGPDS